MVPTRGPLAGAALVAFGACLLAAATSAAGPAGTVVTETDRGLRTTTFRTDRGEVAVYLPDDLASGDTISGTVEARPSGRSAAATRRNGDRLEGYVVELEGHGTGVGSGGLTWAVPAGLEAAEIVLRDGRGREVARGRVPVAPAASGPVPSAPVPPAVGQAGRPIEISGAFDGQLTTSGVTVGGREARLLAESPRKLVAECPADAVGPTTIVVREGGTTTEQPFRGLRVQLSAPRTDLARGESTTLKVEVTGLEGIEEPIPLRVVNTTPSVVNLKGGESQTVFIEPSEVGPGGRFTATREVRGIKAGSFGITARVPAPGPGQVAQAAPEPEPAAPKTDTCKEYAEEVECGTWSEWTTEGSVARRERVDDWVRYCVDPPPKTEVSRVPYRRITHERRAGPGGAGVVETVVKTLITGADRTVYEKGATGRTTRKYVKTVTENGRTIETTVEYDRHDEATKVIRKELGPDGSAGATTTWTRDLDAANGWRVEGPGDDAAAPAAEPAVPERPDDLREWGVDDCK